MTTVLAGLLSAAAAEVPDGVPKAVADDVMSAVTVALRSAAAEIADLYDMTAEIVSPAAADQLRDSADALRSAADMRVDRGEPHHGIDRNRMHLSLAAPPNPFTDFFGAA